MALKHVKRCSISHIIRVIIILTPQTRENRRYDSTFAGKAVGKQALSYTAGGTTHRFSFSGEKFSDTQQ